MSTSISTAGCCTRIFRGPDTLWLLYPLIFHRMDRVRFGAPRGTICDDPRIFVIRDRVSLVAGLSALAIVTAAVLMRAP
jgi:hypothetical protein